MNRNDVIRDICVTLEILPEQIFRDTGDYQRNCEDLARFKDLLKRQHRILAKKYHPDLQGGDVERMKKINHLVGELMKVEVPQPAIMIWQRWNYSGSASTATSYTTTY